jgi:putative ABC transport system ATP-binding protein
MKGTLLLSKNTLSKKTTYSSISDYITGLMTKPWLCTKRLCRFYQRKTSEVRAVDSISLSIERGDFISLVGSSGSGKSTLLNLLAGLDRPTSGDIFLEGEPFSRMTHRELSSYRANKVGMVFQAFNLVPHLSAQMNVELALYFNETPKGKRKSLSAEILSRLGVGERLDHRPADLSGGEQQRVAIARALIKNPDILFADEPTGNLDEENTNDIVALLSGLNRQGLAILMVTHDLTLARCVSKKVLRLHYGQIVDQEGRTI